MAEFLFSPLVDRSDKLVPRHRGPYQVMHISGAIYTIQDLVNWKVIVTHIHNLRPFNYDEERTDPVAVAQQNAQEFVVIVRNGRLWSFKSVGMPNLFIGIFVRIRCGL